MNHSSDTDLEPISLYTINSLDDGCVTQVGHFRSQSHNRAVLLMQHALPELAAAAHRIEETPDVGPFWRYHISHTSTITLFRTLGEKVMERMTAQSHTREIRPSD